MKNDWVILLLLLQFYVLLPDSDCNVHGVNPSDTRRTLWEAGAVIITGQPYAKKGDNSSTSGVGTRMKEKRPKLCKNSFSIAAPNRH